MMLIIEKNCVFLNRGDDARLVIQITDADGADYTLQTGDSLTLTVKAKASGDSPVLLSLSSTTNEIVIPSASTAAMKIGQYSADIELRLAAGQRITVWPLLIGKARTQECNYRNFTLMPEVTGT